MVENDIYLCPTLSVTNCGDYLERMGAPEWQLQKQKEASVTHMAGFESAVEAGIPMVAANAALVTFSSGQRRRQLSIMVLRRSRISTVN
jgi:hypothetical protein